MKRPISPPKPVRWYAQNREVFDRLASMGVPKRSIYEGWNGEHWSKFAMKRGEALGVLDGYRAFGEGRRVINKAVDRFHDQGATVVDVETGLDSRTHGHILLSEALGSRRRSAEFQRRMADEAIEARRVKAGGLSNREAEIEWKKSGIASTDERAELIGIPRSTLYARWGKSGALCGRRPKHLLEK